jgi:hypothetical protein
MQVEGGQIHAGTQTCRQVGVSRARREWMSFIGVTEARTFFKGMGWAREARIDDTSEVRPMPLKSLKYSALSIEWAPEGYMGPIMVRKPYKSHDLQRRRSDGLPRSLDGNGREVMKGSRGQRWADWT